MCAQWRLRSSCASAHTNHSHRYPPEFAFESWLPTECTAKILIRLPGCVGWSVSSVRAHTILPKKSKMLRPGLFLSIWIVSLALGQALRFTDFPFVSKLFLIVLNKMLPYHHENIPIEFWPPLTLLLYSKTGVYRGIYMISLISAQKHRLWELVRTASSRRF